MPGRDNHKIAVNGWLYLESCHSETASDRYPFMCGAILMQQHTRQRTAFPAFAVCFAFGRLGHHLRLLKPVFNPGVTALATIAFIPYIKFFGVPAFMSATVTIHQPHDFIHRRSPVQDLIQPLVDQSFQAFIFISVNIAGTFSRIHPAPVPLLLASNACPANLHTLLRISFFVSSVTILSILYLYLLGIV